MSIVTCPKCNGLGTFGEPPKECDQCHGAGKYTVSWVAILNRIDPPAEKFVYSYQIVEATDDSEYAALSAGNKSLYALIISLGIVDLSMGTKVRAMLADMFGPGTVTRANLLNL